MRLIKHGKCHSLRRYRKHSSEDDLPDSLDILGNLGSLDNLDNLDNLGSLGSLGNLDNLDNLDNLGRLEDLGNLGGLGILDNLGNLDTRALDNLGSLEDLLLLVAQNNRLRLWCRRGRAECPALLRPPRGRWRSWCYSDPSNTSIPNLSLGNLGDRIFYQSDLQQHFQRRKYS